jgi:hypothetical protein
MKQHIVRLFAIPFLLALVCVGVNAQDQTLAAAAGDKYVISAKAGGVNFVEGPVSVSRKMGRSGAVLKGDTLQIGDRVTTGPDGKAEILLNPGSFLRLGGNSAFEFKTTSLDDLSLQLETGSAILEVFAAEEFQVAISSPKSRYVLIQTGVYRVDVLNDGTASLRVWKGGARVGDSARIVKAGRSANPIGDGDVSVAKFDRDKRDQFDSWSRMRGKELAKISSLLKRGDVRNVLMQSFLGRRWNMYNSFGLWVFDPFYGGYCFLPFGYGWSSPYGYGFGGQYIGWYNLPAVIYYPPTTGGGNSGPGNPPVTPVVSAGVRSPRPPFERMQQTMGGGRGIDRGGVYNPSSSSPTYVPSTSSSSPTSAPSPSKVDTPAPTKIDRPSPRKQP